MTYFLILLEISSGPFSGRYHIYLLERSKWIKFEYSLTTESAIEMKYFQSRVQGSLNRICEDISLFPRVSSRSSTNLIMGVAMFARVRRVANEVLSEIRFNAIKLLGVLKIPVRHRQHLIPVS